MKYFFRQEKGKKNQSVIIHKSDEIVEFDELTEWRSRLKKGVYLSKEELFTLCDR
jgi:hypothetical protein